MSAEPKVIDLMAALRDSLAERAAAVAPPSAPPEPTKPYDGYEGWCVVARITTVVGDAFYCQKHEAVWSARDDPPASCRDNGWITPKRLAFMRELHQAPAVSLPEPTLTREQVEALLAAGHVEGPYIPTYTTASGGPPETTAPTATTHGFHQRDGWYFTRLENGAVRIRKTMSSHPASAVEVEQIIPADEWVSVVAHLSAFTDGAVAYGAASELHYGPQ